MKNKFTVNNKTKRFIQNKSKNNQYKNNYININLLMIQNSSLQ